jgi:hypothetical protein
MPAAMATLRHLDIVPIARAPSLLIGFARCL